MYIGLLEETKIILKSTEHIRTRVLKIASFYFVFLYCLALCNLAPLDAMSSVLDNGSVQAGESEMYAIDDEFLSYTDRIV